MKRQKVITIGSIVLAFACVATPALAQMQAEQPSIADRISEWWASLNAGERKRYLKKAGK